jgi:hypothetical protein
MGKGSVDGNQTSVPRLNVHKGKVWFHRIRAGIWVLIGGASFLFGFANNIVLVWLASLYANIVSDWGAAEAADDREVLERLQSIEQKQKEMCGILMSIKEQLERGSDEQV